MQNIDIHVDVILDAYTSMPHLHLGLHLFILQTQMKMRIATTPAIHQKWAVTLKVQYNKLKFASIKNKVFFRLD